MSSCDVYRDAYQPRMVTPSHTHRLAKIQQTHHRCCLLDGFSAHWISPVATKAKQPHDHVVTLQTCATGDAVQRSRSLPTATFLDPSWLALHRLYTHTHTHTNIHTHTNKHTCIHTSITTQCKLQSAPMCLCTLVQKWASWHRKNTTSASCRWWPPWVQVMR